MRIAAVSRALPPHHYDQDTLLEALQRYWGERQLRSETLHYWLERLHRNVRVGGRHLALPLEEYTRLSTWGEHNDAWIRVSQELGEEVVRRVVERAGIGLDRVDTLLFVSTTGVATPSIDARLVNRLGLRPDVRRLPLFGLGCAGGAAGLARAADAVRAHPGSAAVVVAVELCSLTMQRGDLSIPNLIASGLFGDGAAAALVADGGAPAAGPEVVAAGSVFYPGTERIMGWDVSGEGFRVVLSAELPDLIRRRLRGDVDRFLAAHGLSRDAVDVWICHPGGPKVLEAVEEALGLPPQAFELSWESLAAVGNLSSASVLLVLEETLARRPPGPGGHGLLLALGPGFALEMVLLRW